MKKTQPESRKLGVGELAQLFCQLSGLAHPFRTSLLSLGLSFLSTDPDGAFAKVLYDLTTASSLTAFTPHQLLHPPFSASPTLLFLFFQYTSLHKIISSMRVETWAFYKPLHPWNQEQCRAHLYTL